jgi:hypothetical protein
MSESFFDDKIMHLAKKKAGLLHDTSKSAFIDAANMAGQAAPGPGGDPSAQGGAPPAGGMPPGGDPAAQGAPPQGGDPAAGGSLDPAAASPLEARLAALEQGAAAGGGAGGAKPGGGKNEKVEMMVALKQVSNMMCILFDHLKIPIPTQVMLPESVSGIPAGSPQVQQAAQQQAGGGDQQQGQVSSVLGGGGGGDAGGIQPVTGMQAGVGSGGPQKSSSFAGFEGIAVTPQMLHSFSYDEPSNNGAYRKGPPDPRRILGLR